MKQPLSTKLGWYSYIFIGLTLLLAFVLTIRPPWDPDLGWHLRNGEDILRFGAPQGDLYSHTMSGYPWVSHEWLTDVLMYLAYHYWGLLFLSIFFALLAITTYWIAARVSRISYEATILSVLIATLVAYPVVGVRPQLLTLCGVAITLWVLFRWRANPRTNLIYWLIPLMLLWANLHGGFAAGLILMGVFGVAELGKFIIRKLYFQANWPTLTANQLWQLVGVGLISGIVTLINPYTWRVYDELWRTLSNDLVRSGISEWLPVTFNNANGLNLLLYAGLLGVLVAFSWRRTDITKIILAVVFFVVAISSWRNIPLFSLITLPLLADAIEVLLPGGISYYAKSIWVLLIIGTGVGYFGYHQYLNVVPATQSVVTLAQVSDYPEGAVKYIKEHQLSGRLFNEYNWGGYLIWQLPEKQVFIDGRMAIWQTADQDVFKEYQSLSDADEPATTILNKYGVELALVYRQKTLANYFLRRADEWKVVYQDNISALFQRVAATVAQ
ncbi:MAG: hypothetical protein WC400_01975 [Patescibacteria group bacterium]